MHSRGTWRYVGLPVYITASFSEDFMTVLEGLIDQGFAELHKGLCDVYHSAAQA